MRQGPNKNRMRGRGNGRKGGNSRSQSFESNGPDVRVRGNPQQIVEKYLTLARDASSAGDRINAESYYQFAEHYYRVMNAASEQQRQQQQQQQLNAEVVSETQQKGEVSEIAEASENEAGQNARRRRNGRGNGRNDGGAKEAVISEGKAIEEDAPNAEEAVEEEVSGSASA